jgi:hypothetical protein
MKHGIEVACRTRAAVFPCDGWIVDASLLSCQAWIGVDAYTFEATDGGAVGRNGLSPGVGGAGVPSAGSGGVFIANCHAAPKRRLTHHLSYVVATTG